MAEELPEYLRRILERVSLLEDRYVELSDRVDDIDRRLMLIETLLAPAGAGLPTGSRWVLEIFPEEIEEWRRALRTIPLDRLTERERSFLRSMDYYIVSEHKITLPQLIWLTIIKRKAGGILPEIPLVTAPRLETAPHSHSSNPNQRRYGVPKKDVERVMAHYGLSREEAENLIEDTMKVYGVTREEAIQILLPPRGVKVKGYSMPEAELPLTEEVEGYALQELAKPKKCALCGSPIPEGFTFCPKCFAPVVEET